MLGAIDLNEFADAVAPMPRLVNRFETLPAIFPEPFSQHPTPHCFYAQRLIDKTVITHFSKRVASG